MERKHADGFLLVCFFALLLVGSDSFSPPGFVQCDRCHGGNSHSFNNRNKNKFNRAFSFSRDRAIIWQRPPEGSERYGVESSVTEKEKQPKGYQPNPRYKGTLPPGMTKENIPLEALPKEVPHLAPNYQEVPFHLRWTSHHPYSFDFLTKIEEIGHLMTPEQEEEVHQRTKRAARAPRKRKNPKMVTPDKIQAEILSGIQRKEEKLETESMLDKIMDDASNVEVEKSEDAIAEAGDELAVMGGAVVDTPAVDATFLDDSMEDDLESAISELDDLLGSD